MVADNTFHKYFKIFAVGSDQDEVKQLLEFPDDKKDMSE